MGSMFSFASGNSQGQGGFSGGTVTNAINFSGIDPDITTPGAEDLTLAPGGDLILISGSIVVPDGSSITTLNAATLNINPGIAHTTTLGTQILSAVSNARLGFAAGVQVGWTSLGTSHTTIDASFYRDGAAGIIAQRVGTATQEFRIYNTWIDDFNNEFVSFGWKNNTNVFTLEVEALGTGTVRNIAVMGGNVAIGRTAPAAKLDVDQAATGGVLPVLTLRQADVDEDFIKIIGTSDTNVDRALVDAANFTTPGTIAGWIKVNVQDDQGTAPITDGDYYIPFYTAPTA